jgi:hypothetical protein
VELYLQSLWDALGYAQTGYRLACVLVVLWKVKERCGLENGAYLPSFCTYGGKETIGALRTWKLPWKIFFPRSTILCIFELRLMSTLCPFLFPTFSLTFLFLTTCFPCILPVYYGAPYTFFFPIRLVSYLSKKIIACLILVTRQVIYLTKSNEYTCIDGKGSGKSFKETSVQFLDSLAGTLGTLVVGLVASVATTEFLTPS